MFKLDNTGLRTATWLALPDETTNGIAYRWATEDWHNDDAGAAAQEGENGHALMPPSSRNAVALGRIPVAGSIAHARKRMRLAAFNLGDDRRLSMCVYIDNIVAASHDAAHAIQSMDVFDSVLHSRWGLSLKDGSRAVIIPEPIRQMLESEEYPRNPVLSCLGHQIAASGSLTPTVPAAK